VRQLRHAWVASSGLRRSLGGCLLQKCLEQSTKYEEQLEFCFKGAKVTGFDTIDA
jgi:hypothetical protein